MKDHKKARHEHQKATQNPKMPYKIIKEHARPLKDHTRP